MLKTVFDHVINQIMTLVEKQIDQAQDRGHNVKVTKLFPRYEFNILSHS